uniref:Uncharacterized protein n=1 Tax=Engystomops pustulosus TaxID=76066 RepID=A0AAV6YTA7_ENGPU|nr:hypothetical protein GDO81_023258 [Engystomops pustulosus]
MKVFLYCIKLALLPIYMTSASLFKPPRHINLKISTIDLLLNVMYAQCWHQYVNCINHRSS